MKFCKFCGSQLDVSLKTCVNGHNYDSSLTACPYCPKKDYARTVIEGEQGSKRTVIPRDANPSRRNDKTVIDNWTPTLTPRGGPRREKTVIVNDDGPSSPGQATGSGAVRRLVGWLVTFDIQAAGTDFKIYEGRTKIGSAPNNDFVINQPGVSDEHSLLLYRDKKFILKDQLSTNGTIVNGTAIEDTVHLSDNDVIRIGTVTLKLRVI